MTAVGWAEGTAEATVAEAKAGVAKAEVEMVAVETEVGVMGVGGMGVGRVVVAARGATVGVWWQRWRRRGRRWLGRRARFDHGGEKGALVAMQEVVTVVVQVAVAAAAVAGTVAGVGSEEATIRCDASDVEHGVSQRSEDILSLHMNCPMPKLHS